MNLWILIHFTFLCEHQKTFRCSPENSLLYEHVSAGVSLFTFTQDLQRLDHVVTFIEEPKCLFIYFPMCL